MASVRCRFETLSALDPIICKQLDIEPAVARAVVRTYARARARAVPWAAGVDADDGADDIAALAADRADEAELDDAAALAAESETDVEPVVGAAFAANADLLGSSLLRLLCYFSYLLICCVAFLLRLVCYFCAF